MKRSVALLIAIIMCISLLPVLQLSISASNVSNNTVNYKTSGNYIYNWGKREEVATFLSPKAEEFYEKYNSSYDKLSALKGGTSQSNVPSSALYKELKSFMTKAHSHQTNYGETRDLYKFTDCENNGSVISSFYSGVSIGPNWDSGATWNREHTWPNSKGLDGNDENDIMMLRPTSSSENFSRGNKAYGESSGYYFPNSESNGDHDVRGDVARIFLYIYIRWGNTSYAWGESGVIENSEILLKWMEEDPVDTWELGRNDSVQAITGTRNVFVDYPELAFILFSEEIPSDMETPSGNAKNQSSSGTDKPNNPPVEDDCNHIYTNACDTNCDLCGDVRVVNNHVYDADCDADCNICGYIRESGKHRYDYACDNTCNSCGSQRTADHIYIGWVVIEEATTDKAGLEKGTCIYCKAEGEREIPKLDLPNDESPDDSLDSDIPNEPSDSDTSNDNTTDEPSNSDTSSDNTTDEPTEPDTPSDDTPSQGEEDKNENDSSKESLGFFGKIARFFRNLFKKIASIFK